MYGIDLSDKSGLNALNAGEPILSLLKKMKGDYTPKQYGTSGGKIIGQVVNVTEFLFTINKDNIAIAYNFGIMMNARKEKLSNNTWRYYIKIGHEQNYPATIAVFGEYSPYDGLYNKPEYGLEIFNEKGENIYHTGVSTLKLAGYVTRKNKNIVWFNDAISLDKAMVIQLGGCSYIESVGDGLMGYQKQPLISLNPFSIKDSVLLEGWGEWVLNWEDRLHEDMIWVIVNASDFINKPDIL